MAIELKILCSDQPSAFDRNVGKISQFLGVPFSYWSLGAGSRNHSEPQESIVVAHWTAFKELAGARDAIPVILQSVKAILVYGWDTSSQSNEFLRQLTEGSLLQAKANQEGLHRMSIAADSADITLQWAGLDFEVASGSAGVGFELSASPGNAQVLISRDGDPYFVRQTAGTSQLLLLGCGEISDLDTAVSKDASALKEFDRLVPLMMFIRKYFGDRCWQAPRMWGCFLIDDPLLRRRYGQLDYQKLLESMQRACYSTCIAFIPWNYRRTDPRVAGLFRDHSDRYSICVHGCDHTDGEFCGTDETHLWALTRKALWRMEQHERLTGLPFAPVMVFPKGLFSKQALAILAKSRFLAAVNSSPHPVDCVEDCLTLRDLLEPSITKFSHFPLFTRRYPRNLAECVLDLFVGKPLLLVEHHGYFRDGCAAAENFVAKLNALVPLLQWTNLNTICSRVSLSRLDEHQERHVRFYTDRFSLTNDTNEVQSYVLHRFASADSPSTWASINGRRVEVLFAEQSLKILVTLKPGANAEVIVERKQPDIQASGRPQGLLDTTKVLLRRRACEFRDNVLDKSPWASKMAEQSLRWLRASK